MRSTATALLLSMLLTSAVGSSAAAGDSGAGERGTEPGAADATTAVDEAATRDPASAPVVPPVPVTEAGPTLLTEDLRVGVGESAHSGMSVAVHYTG